MLEGPSPQWAGSGRLSELLLKACKWSNYAEASMLLFWRYCKAWPQGSFLQSEDVVKSAACIDLADPQS